MTGGEERIELASQVTVGPEFRATLSIAYPDGADPDAIAETLFTELKGLDPYILDGLQERLYELLWSENGLITQAQQERDFDREP